MASKRIDELDARVVADTDLLPVTPSGGPSGRATVAAIVAAAIVVGGVDLGRLCK